MFVFQSNVNNGLASGEFDWDLEVELVKEEVFDFVGIGPTCNNHNSALSSFKIQRKPMNRQLSEGNFKHNLSFVEERAVFRAQRSNKKIISKRCVTQENILTPMFCTGLGQAPVACPWDFADQAKGNKSFSEFIGDTSEDQKKTNIGTRHPWCGPGGGSSWGGGTFDK